MRDPRVDGLRTLAIVLMVMSHLSRRVARIAWMGWNELSMLLEPLTQALFLFLVGASVVYSHRPGRAWRRRSLLRAAGLWALGFAIGLGESGWTWPWALTNPGVLSTIGVALACCVLLASAPAWLSVAVWTALAAIFVGLERAGLSLPLLNAGNSPLLPDLLFTGLGVAFVLLLRWRPRLLWAAPVVVAGLCLWHPFEEWFSLGWGRAENRYEAPRVVHGLAQLQQWWAGEVPRMRTWSWFGPSVAGAVFIAALIPSLYLAQAPLVKALQSRPGVAALAIGRHALGCYVLHLVLLGASVVIFGRRRALDTPLEALGALLVLLAACYGWAAARDRGWLRWPVGGAGSS